MCDKIQLVGPSLAVASALTGAGPDAALDALTHASVRSGGVDIALADVAALWFKSCPPPYSSDATSSRDAAAAIGILALSGVSPSGGGWASFWLPAPQGDEPILMFAVDEARASLAALAHALSKLALKDS